MGDRRRAGKILKEYALAVREARIGYISTFTNENQYSEVSHGSFRRRFKTIMVCIILLTVVISGFVVLAVMGTKSSLGLEFDIGDEYVKIAPDAETESLEEIPVKFFEVIYIPEDYNFHFDGGKAGRYFWQFYENSSGDWLYIRQRNAAMSSSNMEKPPGGIHFKNTERGTQVVILDYGEYKSYLFRKGNLLIEVYGVISTGEAEKIYLSLR